MDPETLKAITDILTNYSTQLKDLRKDILDLQLEVSRLKNKIYETNRTA